MLSINTNLSSLITQRSMKSATNLLNQAVERMSTGYKVNHAKDNAAAYSIITNMDTKINAYQVAEDNVAMGLDLLTTATESLDLIYDKFTRLRDLAEQASNGTYGAQSLKAINSEANALVDEIERLYSTAEYNGIKLLDTEAIISEYTNKIKAKAGCDKSKLPNALSAGFIEKVTRRDTTSMTKLSSVSDTSDLPDGIYSISTPQELAQLATMVNNGLISANDEFVLANDIDLSSYSNWTPIGVHDMAMFEGVFDGNGHVVKNLKISTEIVDCLAYGLFGHVLGTVKNLGVVNATVTGFTSYTGLLTGLLSDGTIDNCYSTGNVKSDQGGVGGLVGYSGGGAVTSSYSTANVTSLVSSVGGLVGMTYGNVDNCFATGNVRGKGYVGGLIGQSVNDITNSYATGDVYASFSNVGGLVGSSGNIVDNCYATGDIINTDPPAAYMSDVGGLVGRGKIITNSYATGNINNGWTNSGGVAGYCGSKIQNCFATGNVICDEMVAGGVVGNAFNATVVDNCYSTGDVTAVMAAGGVVGDGRIVTNSFATGNITGEDSGGVCAVDATEVKNCYFTGTVTGARTGGIVGYANNTSITDCIVGGQSSNMTNVFVGSNSATINNSTYNSFYNDIGLSLGTNTTTYNNVSAQKMATDIGLQIGIYSNETSRIDFTTSFRLEDFYCVRNMSDKPNDCITFIDSMLAQLNEKQVELGSVSNRLDSALEEISTQYENLVSSRSTLRDADIAEVSSQYIQQQILQQASATLMATANQSPSIALQLI